MNSYGIIFTQKNNLTSKMHFYYSQGKTTYFLFSYKVIRSFHAYFQKGVTWKQARSFLVSLNNREQTKYIEYKLKKQILKLYRKEKRELYE